MFADHLILNFEKPIPMESAKTILDKIRDEYPEIGTIALPETTYEYHFKGEHKKEFIKSSSPDKQGPSIHEGPAVKDKSFSFPDKAEEPEVEKVSNEEIEEAEKEYQFKKELKKVWGKVNELDPETIKLRTEFLEHCKEFFNKNILESQLSK